jgi:CheY-like chemotaxis protein
VSSHATDRRDPATPPARPLVLLVDGHHDTLALNAIALSGMGFEVMAAFDATEAFGRAWKNHPDIIALELVNQGTSGWDLLAHLKSEARTRDIPVVAVTTDAQTETRERARREGCAALIVKPYVPNRLAAALRNVLSSSFAHAQVPGIH